MVQSRVGIKGRVSTREAESFPHLWRQIDRQEEVARVEIVHAGLIYDPHVMVSRSFGIVQYR
jgi:hypothetical protein